ncbi:abortive phage resistance protein, partial [mine drainage metagenome]
QISDAHGKGKRAVRPRARHAELAVNLAGSMAAFLVATWKERTETSEDGNGART